MPASLYNPVFQLWRTWRYPPNVLIGRKDHDVKLIHFDWGGEEAGEEEDVDAVIQLTCRRLPFGLREQDR